MPGPNTGNSQWGYIIDRDYAIAPEHYVRAFLLMQNDLVRLFEIIEPADVNLSTYSYRTHALLIRSCIEAEANFKAILKENTYRPANRKGDPIHDKRRNIKNYQIINKTHHLSLYLVHVSIWAGTQSTITPFAEWISSEKLTWYHAYNKSKHDRHDQVKPANHRIH